MEFLVDINDLLLLLGYTPAPDELIGQATIHKALAEHDAQVRAEERERIRDAIITDQTTGAGDYSEAEEYADKIVGKAETLKGQR